MAEEVTLYNPHAGLTGRDGGPYLDQVERIEAEKRRAFVEDREPDLDNAPATAGTPLVTGGQLLNMAASPSNSNPSQEAANPIGDHLTNLVKEDTFPVNAFATRPAIEDESDEEDTLTTTGEDAETPAESDTNPSNTNNEGDTNTKDEDPFA